MEKSLSRNDEGVGVPELPHGTAPPHEDCLAHESPHGRAHDEDPRQAALYHSKKDRVFVRAIEGEYNLSQELVRLRSQPRVRKASEIKFVDGPQAYSRHYVEPKDGISQLFHIHLEEYGPGGKSQKHGHVNEAAFYILDGVGYEIHDGERYDWAAGDVVIVHNNCVHQHFNASPDRPARALVLKTPAGGRRDGTGAERRKTKDPAPRRLALGVVAAGSPQASPE
ncbi:MAG TPA: cupin domain-containing protein [Trebonia sp.]